MCEKFFAKHGYVFTALARVLFGILFLCHGLMKFGIVGSSIAPVYSMYWFAGVIEIVIGSLIVLGLVTRYAAIFGALHMTMAWFIAHVSQGWNPFNNGGEPAVLFFAAFLYIMTVGAGKLSVDHKLGLK